MAANLPTVITILLIFGVASGNVLFDGNSTSCKYIPKLNMDYSKLNGTWHVQRYTRHGGVVTKCETSTFDLSPDGQSGKIKSSFKMFSGEDDLTLSATLMKTQEDESFRYMIDDFGTDGIPFLVKILSYYENESYTACLYIPQDDDANVVLIATKKKNADPKTMERLVNEAAILGIAVDDMQWVEQGNCP